MRATVETWYEGRPVKVGDYVTVCMYSDRNAYEVVAVSRTGKVITLRPLKATLLNGVGSGEPDALVSHPGGFCHHVTGRQRYRYEPELVPPSGITPKQRQRRVHWSAKRGTYTTRGGVNRLIPGAHEHYDYNF
jgi:hypothetical protein